MSEDKKIYVSKEELEKIKMLKEKCVYWDYGMDTRIKHAFRRWHITTALDFCSFISDGSRVYGLGAKSIIKLEDYLLRLGIVIEGLNDDENLKQLETQKKELEKRIEELKK